MWREGVYHPLPQCPDPALIWIRQAVDCKMAEKAASAVDGIHLAAEVGRLDVLSIVITLFSLAIAVATILGFWFYRGVVDQRAKQEVKELLPSVVKDHLSANPHVLVDAIRTNRDLLRAAFGSDTEQDLSAEIAATIDNQEPADESNNG